MAVSPQFLEYVLEQLAGLPAVRPRRMFDGAGLYSNEVFFAVIHEDTLFFKTDDSTIASYRERRMPQFMPFKDRPATALGYHQVPADILEDPESLVAWARAAVSVAAAKAALRARRSARSPAKTSVTRTAKKASGKAPNKAAKKSARNAAKKTRRRKPPARR